MSVETATRKLILGTAGHIDHGKTALIRALTGVDTDRLPEEKQRGMTIDLGFAHWTCGDTEVGIVDVPGHERFVRNMLAGAAGIDLVVLIVAADDSVMPQTREHFEILQLMGIQHGLIVITKCDLVDAELIELAEMEIRELVAESFLAGAPIIHTSAETGQGIDTLKESLAQACSAVTLDTVSELFRLAIDRSFTMTGQGTVVTGSITSGHVRVGDTVQWLPIDKSLRIRSLQSHGRQVEQAERGQRAAIGLAGAHHREIVRGHELATPGYLQTSRALTVVLRALDSSGLEIKHRNRVRLHIGTGAVVATVNLLSRNKIAPGESAIAQLLVAEPVSAVYGQPFVVRRLSPVVMLGGGTVLQPIARRMRRSDGAGLELINALASTDVLERTAAAVRSYGTSVWTPLDLCRDSGLNPSKADQVIRQLQESGQLVPLSLSHDQTVLIHRNTIETFDAKIVKTVKRHHKEHPLTAAVDRHQLVELVGAGQQHGMVAALIDQLVGSGRLKVTGDGVALANFAPHLSTAQQKIYDGLRASYQRGGLRPPSTGELRTQLDTALPQLRMLRDLAVQRREVVHLGGDLYLDVDFERKLRTRVVEALGTSAGLTLSEIRQVLDTSRKFAVPFCEYLDRIGITKRQGDQRVLAQQK